jgi:tetratricopeptide (TPR) repeat protein
MIPMRLKKTIFLTLFTLLLMAGCTSFYNKTELSTGHIAPLVKKIQPAVVTIIAYDVNRKVSNLGSGFFIDKKGYLITNYHVLEGSYAADVKTYDGKEYPIELVVAENKPSDVIKVWVNIPESSIRWITVTEKEPSIADRVVVVGSPLGLEQTVSEGIISAVRELPIVGKVFQLSAPISPGSSGSPVVNMRGKVVGVASFQTTRGQNLNFAVSGKGVLDLKPSKTSKTLSEWTYAIKMKSPRLAEKLCKEGFNFSIRGEFKDALNYFKEATEKSPDDTVAWYGLGGCYDGLDQPEQALEAYKQVIRLDPKNAAPYFNLARYYRKLGRYEKAIETYYQAIETDPDHAPSYFDLGMVYGKLEEFKNGEEAFKQVLRINPDHAPTHFYMGLTYNNLGRYDAAVTSYTKALKIEPDSAAILYNLGIAYGGLGDSKAEIEAFKQAIRVDPDFAPAHYNMGLIYLNNSDKAAALEEYKILKELNPEMAEMLFKQIY